MNTAAAHWHLNDESPAAPHPHGESNPKAGDVREQPQQQEVDAAANHDDRVPGRMSAKIAANMGMRRAQRVNGEVQT